MEADIRLGDTMRRPAFSDAEGRLRRFDLVTANPLGNRISPSASTSPIPSTTSAMGRHPRRGLTVDGSGTRFPRSRNEEVQREGVLLRRPRRAVGNRYGAHPWRLLHEKRSRYPLPARHVGRWQRDWVIFPICWRLAARFLRRGLRPLAGRRRSGKIRSPLGRGVSG